MSKFAPVFNGVDLSSYLRVTSDFERGVGTTRTNTTIKVGNTDGELYKGYTLGRKIIPMPFILRNNLIEKRRELAQILNVSEPAPLIFPDEPDIYYLAVFNDDISLTENNFLGKGTINWLVPDGVAHSVDEKTVNNVDSSKIDVTNSGTYETYPVLEATMQSDNGFIGFINQEGKILQFGNPNEVDGVSYQQSETLINDRMNVTVNNANMNGWELNKAVCPDDFIIEQNGQVAFGTYIADYFDNKVVKYAAPHNYGSANGKTWYGVSLTKKLPNDSEGVQGAKNWSFIWRAYQIIGRTMQTGMSQFSVTDKNGNNIATMLFYKNNSVNNLGIILFFVKGKQVHRSVVPFTYANPATGWGTGQSSIKKFGNTLEFYTNFTTWTYTDNSLTDIEASEVSWVGARVKAPNESFTINMLEFVNFYKHNVDKWNDIPNKFANGDVLSVNTSSGLVTVNGMRNYNVGAIGNEWFPLRVGDNTINCLWSDWATQPKFEVKWREKWL